jgi:LuxR family transcriptional regulator, maltose regulon positive regulatory protein
MDVSVVPERHLASTSGFGLRSATLHRPLQRPGAVRRSSLIERLERGDLSPVVSVVAPAGYGKTTLLSQWAETSGQTFAWVSVEASDNDPKALLSHVAEALDAIDPIDDRVWEALASPISSVSRTVLPRLRWAFASVTPVVLVLDDVHVLDNPECRAALSALGDHVPGGSRLVLAGRAEPPLKIARLRAEGRIVEIGAGDLALSPSEAATLLRNTGVTLGEDDMTKLYRQTEGWPAGLYLAALCLREGGPYEGAVAAFDGGDRFVSDYIESEFLTRISRQQRVFLTRTAVLDRMSGPLCDTVLELSGSAATLADLARSNLLLVPLDRQGKWYRYHHLFRDMLLAELSRFEPELMPELRRRAASWCSRNELPEAAVEYSIAAGDVDEVARQVATMGVPAYQHGRIATVRRWFQWLEDRRAIQDRPILAAHGGVLAALTGRPADAERWADMADRWQDSRSGPDDPDGLAWATLLRAVLCRGGVEQMRADADEAVRRFTVQNIAAPAAVLAQGIARALSGDLDGADAALEEATSIGERVGVLETIAVALCERSLIAIARGQWERAGVLAGQARGALRRAGIADSYATPLVCAARARIAWRRGDVPAVRQELASARRLRSALTYALPHLAVQARLELAEVHIAIADMAGARTLMREVDELLRRRPGLGTLASQAQAIRARLSERGASADGAPPLTGAEFRLLPMLATHLSVPEIAAEMFLSRNTIRSQTSSVYRKLGVSSRSQAVSRCRELGLLAGLSLPAVQVRPVRPVRRLGLGVRRRGPGRTRSLPGRPACGTARGPGRRDPGGSPRCS